MILQIAVPTPGLVCANPISELLLSLCWWLGENDSSSEEGDSSGSASDNMKSSSD